MKLGGGMFFKYWEWGDLCDAVWVGSLESTAYLHLLVGDLGDLELHTACVDPSI